MTTSIKMFSDRKSSKMFAELSATLKGEQRTRFTDEVKKLFDKKSVSEDGEYSSFQITVEDLISLADRFGRNERLIK